MEPVGVVHNLAHVARILQWVDTRTRQCVATLVCRLWKQAAGAATKSSATSVEDDGGGGVVIRDARLQRSEMHWKPRRRGTPRMFDLGAYIGNNNRHTVYLDDNKWAIFLRRTAPTLHTLRLHVAAGDVLTVDMKLLAQECAPTLRHFALCAPLSAADAYTWAMATPRLESCTLVVHDDDVTDAAFTHACNVWPALSTFELCVDKLARVGRVSLLQLVSTANALRALEVRVAVARRVPLLNEPLLRDVATRTNLRSLRMHTDACVDMRGVFMPRLCADTLHTLHLAGAPGVADAHFVGVGRSCHALRNARFDLRWAQQDAVGMMAVARGCPVLASLIVGVPAASADRRSPNPHRRLLALVRDTWLAHCSELQELVIRPLAEDDDLRAELATLRAAARPTVVVRCDSTI
jgi:hypothetical protein